MFLSRNQSQLYFLSDFCTLRGQLWHKMAVFFFQIIPILWNLYLAFPQPLLVGDHFNRFDCILSVTECLHFDSAAHFYRYHMNSLIKHLNFFRLLKCTQKGSFKVELHNSHMYSLQALHSCKVILSKECLNYSSLYDFA